MRGAVGGFVRLLAVDESSNTMGIALFDGSDPVWTRIITAPGSLSWRLRMRAITRSLRAAIETLDLVSGPEVVAIEDAVVARPRPEKSAGEVLFDVERPGSSGNPMTGVKMGECRGWLMAHFDAMWPTTRIVSVSPAKVRAAAGLSAFARRAESKDAYRRYAEALLPGRKMTEDEADAVCIGLAALAQLKAEHWIGMAAAR